MDAADFCRILAGQSGPDAGTVSSPSTAQPADVRSQTSETLP